MNIKPCRRLNKSSIFQNFKELETNFIFESKVRENKYNSFIKDKLFINELTGDSFKLEAKYLDKMSEYNQQIFQNSKFVSDYALKNNYNAFILTLTGESKYYPFSMVNKEYGIYDINPNYEFKDNEELGLKKAYEQLQKIFRRFYKTLKKYNKGKVLFIKVVEPHKSMVPHMHIIFFVEKIDKVEDQVERLKEKFNLNQVKLDLFEEHDNKEVKIRSALSYFLKYMRKSFDTKDFNNWNKKSKKYSKRFLDGWKKELGILMFSCSRLDFPSYIYKKIYKSLPKELKDDFLKKAKKDKTVLKSIIRENLYIESDTYIDNKVKTKIIGKEDALIKVYLKKERIIKEKIEYIRKHGKYKKYLKKFYNYKIHEMDIYLNDFQIYEKPKFIKLNIKGISEKQLSDLKQEILKLKNTVA